MKDHDVKNTIVKYGFLTAGSFIYSIGLSLFLDPNNLAPGGLSGIAVILDFISGFGTGTWFFFLNIPLVFLGLWRFGARFIVSTFYAVAMISVFTNILSYIPVLSEDMIIAALCGGALIGIGMGLIFRYGATTGGTDIIVKLLRQRFKYIKTGSIFLLTDVVILLLAAIVFGDLNKAFYAAIAVYVNALTLDLVLYGRDEAKMVYVISDASDDIAGRILDELEIGVTYLEGRGAYTNARKQVIMCVVKKQIYPELEEIVKEVDPEAFLVISSASEIYGEGYKDIKEEKI